jgi:YegS/Rv2252/BmrU family lipid kinase
MAAQLTILVNQSAGLGPSDRMAELTAGIQALDLDAKVVTTESADEMTGILRRMADAGVPQVVVAGGDGTVACAARELAHTETALGIIPQGTANNFATSLGLPRELPAALKVIMDGTVRQIDLGRVGTHLFTEAAGIGFFADALALYGQGGQARAARVLFATARVWLSMSAKRIRLSIDGEPYRERVVMCTVANTSRMALADTMAPDARVTDGLLDVILIGDLSRLEFITYYRAIKTHTHLQLPKVASLKAKEVRIESRGPMNVHCDDRVVGQTPALIGVEPGALRVVVGKR